MDQQVQFRAIFGSINIAGLFFGFAIIRIEYGLSTLENVIGVVNGQLLIARGSRSLIAQDHQPLPFDVCSGLKQHGSVIHDLGTERVNRLFEFFLHRLPRQTLLPAGLRRFFLL